MLPFGAFALADSPHSIPRALDLGSGRQWGSPYIHSFEIMTSNRTDPCLSTMQSRSSGPCARPWSVHGFDQAPGPVHECGCSWSLDVAVYYRKPSMEAIYYYLVYKSILGCRRQSIVALMDLKRSLKLCLKCIRLQECFT